MAARVATKTATLPGPAPEAADASHSTADAPHSIRVEEREECCALYHRAVELIGKRWTGAILLVLLDGPLRFSEVRQLVPDLSDRLLSERMKELEAEGIVERRVFDGGPVRVEYALTRKGHALEPVVRGLKSWANSWLD
jgi:DNA-binding HxlR family transcriptional regulator